MVGGGQLIRRGFIGPAKELEIHTVRNIPGVCIGYGGSTQSPEKEPGSHGLDVGVGGDRV